MSEEPTPKIDESKVREDIQNIVGHYCDGTWDGLERAIFISWGDTYTPQKCADDLVAYVMGLLKGGST